MQKYDHKKLDDKWRKRWAEANVYRTAQESNKEKFYILDMFPYPSGSGLHVGHPKGYIATDIISRYKKMKGYNVLHPMGWDAFGLPAEQHALKNKVHPKINTDENIARYKEQLEKISLNYDWEREISTTDPEFYKWTQWAFIQMFNKGLVYESNEPINWCPSCKTGLANEDLEDGKCERCDSEIEKKPIRQWVIKITDYADRLLADIDNLDWQESIKESQRNWIGRSEGSIIPFSIKKTNSTPKKVLVLHGTGGDHTDNWQPWLKESLTKMAYEVEIPDLPDAMTPSLAEWKKHVEYFFENQNESVIIVAHSLGCNLALHLAERYQNIDSMILVAPPHYSNQDWNSIEESFGKTTTDSLKSFIGADVDFDKVNDNVNSIVAFYSDDDPYIPIDTAEIYQRLGVPSKIFTKHGHFNEMAGIIEFPDLFEAVLQQVSIDIFTTRPDTLFGATYMVLAPEHKLVQEWLDKLENKAEVEKYIKEAGKKTHIERGDMTKEKTGVELKGVKAINPANNEELPIYIADYVMADYGTGAIMAVPAHDERDYEFAKKFRIEIKTVIANETGDKRDNEEFRDGGAAIVFDPETQLYAVPKGDKNGITLYAGGVDEGETVHEAILREVKEESGLTKYSSVHWIDVAHAHYFNRLKEVNRVARAECLLVVLADNTPEEVSLEDHEDFELTWMTASDIRNYWEENNQDGGYSHYIEFLNRGVAKAIELGVDKTSDVDKFVMRPRTNKGVIENSGKFSGLSSEDGGKKITEFVGGKMTTSYKLRDWVFARQRYWGEPIPLIHCGSCGIVPVPEEELPLVLPEVESYEPTGTGESPLAGIDEWVNTKCPSCGGDAKRETNTMPQWAGSSWYYLRYIDPHNDKALVDKKKEAYWSPVDFYVGGAEHATRHLIYARFWHKFLYDIGVVSYDEPFTKLQTVGLIMAEDGRKMSKRWGNVVNPDSVIDEYGADTFRTYEMFMGPFDQSVAWSTKGLLGPNRFLGKVWRMQDSIVEQTPESVETQLHKTIKKVGEDIGEMKYNTAISEMMILVNEVESAGGISRIDFESLLKILSPFAPHMTQELWELLGNDSFITQEEWPTYDEAKLIESTVTIAVQVNGKVRAEIEVPVETTESEMRELALANETVDKWVKETGEGVVKRFVYVTGRLANIVVQ